MLLDALLFALGVACLVGGAWALVSGGGRLAAALGVPPVLVGLTVVAWGTSAPELVVSLTAALKGNTDIMLGNVMGSNVANVGLILGAAILLLGPSGDRSLWRLEMPVLLVGTALFVLLGLDGHLGPLDGALLMLLFAVVTLVSIRGGIAASRARNGPGGSPRASGRVIIMGGVMSLAGCGAMVLGSQLIVESATRIAQALGAPEMIIGLTLVAVGTSLPELATTLVAAVRKESGIALGNVVGSNLFNLLAVGGPTALLADVTVTRRPSDPETMTLLVSTGALALVLVARERIPRAAGFALLILYALCVAWWIA